MHHHHLRDIIRGEYPLFFMADYGGGIRINTQTKMIDTTIFHIYDKATNEPVKVCLTVEELEQLIAARSIDWKQWEVEPCYTEYGAEDASF